MVYIPESTVWLWGFLVLGIKTLTEIFHLETSQYAELESAQSLLG